MESLIIHNVGISVLVAPFDGDCYSSDTQIGNHNYIFRGVACFPGIRFILGLGVNGDGDRDTIKRFCCRNQFVVFDVFI